jgi:hypothetical protein
VVVHFKERGQWKSQQTGSLPDGSKVVGNYQVAITDNGNTHT